MSKFDIINSNLVYKDQEKFLSYVFTNNKILPIVGKDAMVRITKDKDEIFLGFGKIIRNKNKIISILLEDIKINKLFPENPEEINLLINNIINTKLDFMIHNKPLEYSTTLYKLVSNDKFIITPKVMDICKDCKINIGVLQNLPECSLNTIPENLRLLARRRMQRNRQPSETDLRNVQYDILEETNNVEEIERLVDDERRSSDFQFGSAKHKKTKKKTNKKQNMKGGICGKKTKSGKSCKVIGNCRFH